MAIVALARKLLIVLWRFVTTGLGSHRQSGRTGAVEPEADL